MLAEQFQGCGAANGTFGELLQGALPGEGGEFLITFPITVQSRVQVCLTNQASFLEIDPPKKQKTANFVASVLKHLGVSFGADIQVRSNLIEGKGLASSSADMVAAARAVSDALKVVVDPSDMCELLSKVEPTDGVMYPEFVSFYHRRVRLMDRLGLPQSAIKVLAIDEGGEVDTIAFNKARLDYSQEDKNQYFRLLVKTKKALETGSVRALGQVATKSAVLHQRRLPKRNLELFLQLREAYNGAGVIVTHSGPCIGMLFESHQAVELQGVQEELKGRGFETFQVESLSY